LFISGIHEISTAEMNGGRRKRRAFMIADIIGDLSPSRSNTPPEANNSQSATGSDVIVDDVIDCSAQSAAIITSRDRTENNLRIELMGTFNQRLPTEDLCREVEGTVPFALFSASAETFAPGRTSAVKPALSPGGVLQNAEAPRSSGCFQESGILPGGVDEGLREMAGLSLNQTAARRCVTAPLHWQAVVQHVIHAAGRNNIRRERPTRR